MVTQRNNNELALPNKLMELDIIDGSNRDIGDIKTREINNFTEN